MNYSLTITAEDLDSEKIQSLTRDLCNTINKETDFNASIGEQESRIGSKGDPITIGAIVLAVLGTGGGAAALINVFKSFIDKSKELSIKIKRPGGDEIEISTKNIDTDEIKSMLKNLYGKP